MKATIIASIFFSILIVHPPLLAQPQSDSKEDSVSSSKRQFVLVDITGFPMNHTYSVSWQPYRSVRVGYGREIEDLLELRVYAEYSQFDFDTNDPMSTLIYSPGRRRDFAVYPEIIAFRFVEIAIGGYYKIQDEVVSQVLHTDPPPPLTTFEPAVKKLGVYIHYGVNGSIHIAGPVNISLGLFLRHDMTDGLYFGYRAGIKYEI